MASELPRFARDWDVEAYPPVVRARIDKYGLGAELARRAPKKKERQRTSVAALVVLGVALLAVFAAVSVLLRR